MMRNIAQTLGLTLGAIAGLIAVVALWLFSVVLTVLPLAVAIALGIWLYRALA